MKYTVDEADIIVINAIKTRALKRFRYQSRETLIREAKEALMTSYCWSDDLCVDVAISDKKSLTSILKVSSNKTHRLVNGITSPRFWGITTYPYCKMAALDIIYFFTSIDEAKETLKYCLPNFKGSSEEEFKMWLATFSPRAFQKDLINALYDDAIESSKFLFKLNPKIDYSFLYERIAMDAIAIDCMAWKRGFKTINLAKAAMVWRPLKRLKKL
jgi:hypothetical protein